MCRAALLTGEVVPSGKLPVSFPRGASDAPTSDSARYPGVRGQADYSEGVLVGSSSRDIRLRGSLTSGRGGAQR